MIRNALGGQSLAKVTDIHLNETIETAQHRKAHFLKIAQEKEETRQNSRQSVLCREWNVDTRKERDV